MNTSKQILAVMLSLLVCVGAVCAQVCDISCAVQSDRVAASSEAQRHTSPSGHCHQQSPESESQEQPAPQPDKDHSSDCQSHNYAVELINSGKNTVADAFQKGDSPSADPFLPFVGAFDRLGKAHTPAMPDRSPPSRTFSSLRI